MVESLKSEQKNMTRINWNDRSFVDIMFKVLSPSDKVLLLGIVIQLKDCFACLVMYVVEGTLLRMLSYAVAVTLL